MKAHTLPSDARSTVAGPTEDDARLLDVAALTLFALRNGAGDVDEIRRGLAEALILLREGDAASPPAVAVESHSPRWLTTETVSFAAACIVLLRPQTVGRLDQMLASKTLIEKALLAMMAGQEPFPDGVYSPVDSGASKAASTSR